MSKKKLTIEFETDADDDFIKYRVKQWLNDEFWNPHKCKVNLENIEDEKKETNEIVF